MIFRDAGFVLPTTAAPALEDIAPPPVVPTGEMEAATATLRSEDFRFWRNGFLVRAEETTLVARISGVVAVVRSVGDLPDLLVSLSLLGTVMVWQLALVVPRAGRDSR